MITVQQLAVKVQKMRAAQSRYFKDRSSENFRDAIALEKDVDSVVSDLLDRPLFGDEPDEHP